jgi:signal transduction histidine kinase
MVTMPEGPARLHGVRSSASAAAIATIVWICLALYVGIVVVTIMIAGSRLAGAGEPPPGLLLIAVPVVALTLPPVERWVTERTNRIAYGQRASPWDAVQRLADEMGRQSDPDEMLESLAGALRQATGAERVEIRLRTADELVIAASAPDLAGTDLPHTAAEPAVILPLRPGDRDVGSVAVFTAPGDGLDPNQRRLAEDLAAKASIVGRQVQLRWSLRQRLDVARLQRRELARSRARTVVVQDQERRRLERDIHDTCQQRAVTLAGKLGLISVEGRADPSAAVALIDEVEADVGRLRASIRRFSGVHRSAGLLADGLASAIRDNTDGVPVRVDVVDGVGRRYPPPVEEAIFFCCLEAVQNAVKHAGASAIEVRLTDDGGGIGFAVHDDGSGFETSRTVAGSGLDNMGRRLAEVGGRLAISSTPAGAVVSGRVPAVHPAASR